MKKMILAFALIFFGLVAFGAGVMTAATAAWPEVRNLPGGILIADYAVSFTAEFPTGYRVEVARYDRRTMKRTTINNYQIKDGKRWQ